jgi:mannose-6-phosphate isomerase-like protein (cupin superfamily)
MKGFIANLETLTLENSDYRRVLYTGKNSQLVLMSLKPGEEIGEETHHLDQFLRFESGQGMAILDGVKTEVTDGSAVLVPAGTKHNFINISPTDDLKLYTLYSPPEHRDGIVRKTKADAENPDNVEEFDGVTTEPAP